MIFHRTSLTHVSSQTRSGRRRLAAAALILAIASFGVGGLGGAGVAEAMGTQDPATVTTTSAALGTDPTGASGAPVTTAPSADVSSPTTSGRSAEIDAENRRIMLIVGALVAVALALVVMTIRYWRATRPVLVDATVSDADPSIAASPPIVDRTGRRSRRAVAGADHAAADEAWEPRATGEQPRIDPPATGRPARPSSEQRAAALSAGGK